MLFITKIQQFFILGFLDDFDLFITSILCWKKYEKLFLQKCCLLPFKDLNRFKIEIKILKTLANFDIFLETSEKNDK